MIDANKERLHVKGDFGDLLFEFDEIFKAFIAHDPEIVQAVVLKRGKQMLSADVDKERFKATKDLLTLKIALEKDGDYDEDTL